jgi:hypothetical protein
MHVGAVAGNEGAPTGLIHRIEELLLLGAEVACWTLHLDRQKATVP